MKASAKVAVEVTIGIQEGLTDGSARLGHHVAEFGM